MRRLFVGLLVLSVGGCVAPPRTVLVRSGAPAASGVTVQLGALSGRRQRVNFLAGLNPDCSEVGEHIDIPAAPSHGSLDMVAGREFPSFPVTNPRSKCNDRRVPGTLVFYTSEPGYHGVDTFTVRMLSETGFLTTQIMTVTVE